MKAKIKPRINLENRTPLQDVIPLSTPMILFVDPSSVCNFKCGFCPTGNRQLVKETGRFQGQMDFGLYQKIIDDLGEFDEPLKVLRLYKDGEPLLNKRLADMVRYARESGRVRYIDITTNGYLLEPDVIKPILDAGLDRLNISVDGMSDEQFLEFTGVRVDFEKFVGNIRRLYDMKGDCEISIKTVGDSVTDEQKQRFFDVFGDYADRIFVENVAPCWPELDIEDRLGVTITRGIYDQPIGDVNTCPYVFYSMSVNSDGSVSLCFLDWARKLIIGDVREQSLKSIWKGDALFQHQLTQLRGEREENAVCRECHQLSHCLPDNIDPYVEELEERLLAAHKTGGSPTPQGRRMRRRGVEGRAL
jgi:radical SAM protein with 4Fe4S-binding SPASM domain